MLQTAAPAARHSWLRRLVLAFAVLCIAAFAGLMLTKTLPYYTFEKGIHFPTAETTVPAVRIPSIAVARQVPSRFEVGERAAATNPKYARVGGNLFWKNDEWWVENQVARR